jgi:N-acetylglucosaminyldiphosphoundecaprenol N-acetyl-beta-D-mannosaminyltransferase
MKPDAKDKMDILGVRVDRVDQRQALEAISAFLETDGCKQIVTLNPEYVMLAGERQDLRGIINTCELSVPDGMGIIWASRLMGDPLDNRVTGTGLLPAIGRMCAEKGYSLFLLGGREGVADLTAKELTRLHPSLEIAGTSSSDPEEGDAAVAEINRSGADILAVAYGCPKQDFWIDKHRSDLVTVRAAIGVGGAFDFISGQMPRAPRVMRRMGLEWLFRLWLEPGRASRMLALPRFGLRIAAVRFRRKDRS